MKRIIISILLSVVIWGMVQAQDTDLNLRKIYVSSELGYSLSPFTQSDGTYSTGILSGGSVDLNSLLPEYKLGGVPNQQMWNDKDIFGFYVSTDTLDLAGADLYYSVIGFPEEKIRFDAETGRFLFYPDSTDITGFTLTLVADAGEGYEVSQDVYFGIVPTEGNMLDHLSDKKRELPDVDNYFTITKTEQRTGDLTLNGETHSLLLSYSVSGVELRLNAEASSSSNSLSSLNGIANLKELNIYAERVIVESPFFLNSTDVNIYADEVIFEKGASISTTSLDSKASGNVNLYARELTAKHNGPLFYMSADNVGKITHSVPGVSYTGKNGEYVDKPYAWLHSNWLLQTAGLLNDAFIDQQNGYVKSYCDFYTKQIADYKNSEFWKTSDIELLELEGIASEMQAMSFKIRNNFDYFGNSRGFMPMLSFEVNQNLYKQEIDRSIRTLYFTYWMKEADKTIQERLDACKEAIKQEKDQLINNIVMANELSVASNMLQANMSDLVIRMDTLTIQLDKKTEDLLQQAEGNVAKFNKINLAKKIVAPAIKVVGIVGGVVVGAYTGNEKAAETGKKAGEIGAKVSDGVFDFFNPPLDTTYAKNPPYAEFYNTLKSDASTFSGSVSTFSGMLNGVNVGNLGSRANVLEMGKDFNTSSKSMLTTIAKFENAASKTSVTNEEIQTELNKLLAESPEYSKLVQDVSELNKEKENVSLQMFSTFNQLTSTVYAVQRGIVTIDALNVARFDEDLKKDFKTMLYIDNLERDAKNRLLKSHYYMGRSYEYSFLEAYEISLNTDKLFEKCKTLAANASNSSLSPSDFDALKVIYENDLASVQDKIIDRFQKNNVPKVNKILYTLNKDQLQILNSDSLSLTVNMFEDGKFPLNEMDTRILDINIKSLDFEVNGEKVDPDRYFDLGLIHEGNSRFLKDGKIVGFTHKNSSDVKPIKWSFRCFQDKDITKDTMSPSSLSLLNNLLNKVISKENVFAKPAAWGELVFERRNEYNEEQMQININKLQLEISYEAIQGGTYQPAAFVSTASNLKPTIQLIVNDVPKVSASGFYAQTFENRYSKLQLKAPQRFGEWDFTGWVDQNGKQLSKNADFPAGYINENKYFRATYSKKSPSLELVGSHNLPKEKGHLQIKVENGGSENLEWVASPEETWFKIKAGNKGVNDGYITIEIDENDDSEREGKLRITSNAGDKDVMIVQKGGVVTGLEEDNISSNGKDYVLVYMKENASCYIDLNQDASIIKVSLYDLNGRSIKHISLRNMRTFDCDLSDLMKGAYLLKVQYDDKVWNQKLIKY